MGLSDIMHSLQGAYVQSLYMMVSLVIEERLKRTVAAIIVWEVSATKVCTASVRIDKGKRVKRIKGGRQ